MRRELIAIFLLTLCWAGACRGSALSASDKWAILNEHNQQRCAIGSVFMPPIYWDSVLESTAQSFVNTCPNGDLNDPRFGSNWAGTTDTGASGLSMAQGWSCEKPFYTFSSNTCDMTGVTTACSSDGCGHYTQMIWSNSLRVGCATNAATCGSPNWPRQLICLYSPPGNFIFNSIVQKPYNPAAGTNGACSPTYNDTASYCPQTCQNGATCTSFNYCSCVSNATTRNFCSDTTTNFPAVMPNRARYYPCIIDSDCGAFASKCCPTAAFGVGNICGSASSFGTLGSDGCPLIFSPSCSPTCASGSSYCTDTNLCAQDVAATTTTTTTTPVPTTTTTTLAPTTTTTAAPTTTTTKLTTTTAAPTTTTTKLTTTTAAPTTTTTKLTTTTAAPTTTTTKLTTTTAAPTTTTTKLTTTTAAPTTTTTKPTTTTTKPTTTTAAPTTTAKPTTTTAAPTTTTHSATSSQATTSSSTQGTTTSSAATSQRTSTSSAETTTTSSTKSSTTTTTTKSRQSTTTTVTKSTSSSTKQSGSSGGCFAASSLVRIGGGGVKRLSELLAGDLVESVDDDFRTVYTPVLYVAHHDDARLVALVRLFFGNASIELTPGHLLYSAADATSPAALVQAGQVRVGDWLVLAGGQRSRVAKIDATKQPVRNPLTANDRIVVSDVAASVFVGNEHVYGVAVAPLKAVHRVAPSLLRSSWFGAFIDAVVWLSDVVESKLLVAPLK